MEEKKRLELVEAAKECGIYPSDFISYSSYEGVLVALDKYASEKIKPIIDSSKKLNLLLSLAKDLRIAQKEFFKNRSVNVLKECKKLEVELDAVIIMIEKNALHSLEVKE